MLLDPVIAVLRHRNRPRLADLLSQSELQVDEIESDGGWDRERCLCLQLTAPIQTYEQLKNLRHEERDAILEAFTECHRDGPRAKYLTPVLDTASLGEPKESSDSLIHDIDAQRSLMVDVATGGHRIQEVDEQYMARRGRIAQALAEISVEDPNPFDSLWDWYGKWNKNLPTYRSRREYLSDLFKPTLAQLRTRPGAARQPLFKTATGWPAIDRGQVQMRQLLERAQSAQQFQSVGLHCRELLITLAQTVFDPERHPTIHGQEASTTDAKRMLEAYIESELTGRSNEELRKHARAAFDLANALQHRRTANFRDAALCAEATTSIVNLIAIVSGRRDPEAR